MTDALVSSVVKELGAKIKDEVGLLASVKEELKSLSSKFSAIQALLVDAERQQNTTEGVRDWLGKLKEVAYEVEDILDVWRTDAFISQHDEDEDDSGKIQKVRSCLLFPCLCFKQLKSRHDIGHRIREVIEKLDDISKEKSDFNLEKVNMGEGMSRLNVEEHETSSLIDESEIFGRDEVKEEIIRQLVAETGQNEKPTSIVSIVGMGGLGKTTVARQVCNDKRVVAYFEKLIWVRVSDHPDVNRIATEVIKSLDSSPPDNLDLDTLLHNLRKAVDGKLFLLVLDDVWDENGTLWQKLRVPLKSAAPGSGIVVTTRSLSVAEKMETTYIHDLGVLSNSDCWKLFKSIAFKEAEDEECQELAEIGGEIVERCKGVPLAIRALGSLLRANRNKWYWEHVLESEIWNWDVAKDDNGILPALLLSYYNLPPRLQQCLSFCSVFPKDHEIKKDELVKLWMAHGIIKSEEDVTEEIGEMYFDYLLASSLFQDAEKDEDGNVVGCKMQDLVHDLTTFVSFGDYCSMEAGDSELSSIKCHHLSLLVNDAVSSIPSPLCNAKRLRTLLLFGSSTIKEVPHGLFNHLKFLRALDLRETEIENLPSSLGKLKHLRYLDLSKLNITELPESVSDLCNMQTLKLYDCGRLCLLPSGISKMVKLLHLEIEGTTNLKVLPNGISRMTSLRTLCKFPVGDEENRGCKIVELKNLNLLRRELRIENLERVMNVNDAREAKLHKKTGLHVLSLCCNDKSDKEWRTLGDDEMKRMDSILGGLTPPHSNLKKLEIENYAGSKFPSWLDLEGSRFSSLVEVVLKNCRKCMLLPGLGKLHSLKYLKIIRADEVNVVDRKFYGIVNDARAKETRFPKLEDLHFESMLNWEKWWLTQEYGEVMSSLKKLRIINCKKLKATPNCLPSTLWEVTIENCNEVIWAQENPLPHLLHLTLKKVRGMSSKPLPYLPALKILYMAELSCESLPSDGWGLLKSLRTLIISNCPELSSLPDGLGQLKALQTLRILSCERLSSLPEGLGQLKALQTLKIRGCERLSSLPEGLGQLEALQTLEIGSCERLSSLPEGLGQLEALQTLEISSCERLSSLPEGLGQLEALQTLEISSCEGLSSLPKGLGQLKGLQTLEISDCKGLSSLPEGLGQLEALQTLKISDCKGLSSLPEGLGQLKALQTLEISCCDRLSSLPEGLGQLEALQTLKIWSCERLSSPFDRFEQLKPLCTLHIDPCPQLRPLPILQHPIALEKLTINNCPLVTERLEKEGGEDWCKISHIPYIQIDGKRIQ